MLILYTVHKASQLSISCYFFLQNLNKSCIDSSTGCPKWIAFDGGYFLVAPCSHANVSAWLSGKIHFHSHPHDRLPPRWPCCRELHWFTEEANPFNTTALFSLLSEASPEIDVWGVKASSPIINPSRSGAGFRCHSFYLPAECCPSRRQGTDIWIC